MNIDEYYMQKSIDEATKAYELDEIPVGAVIVKDNEIIASSFNKKEKKKDPTAHAEMLAIKEACRNLNTPYLYGCTLYVTYEPCIMCTGAILNSRLDKIVFGTYDHKYISLETIIVQLNKKNANHIPLIQGGILEEKCTHLLQEYFKKKREN